jgi:hypothetical protein
VIHDAFWRLLRGSSLHELVWLFGRYDELHNYVYIFKSLQAEAVHPPFGSVPWPVLLWLGARSKKYVDIDVRFPGRHSYHTAFLRAAQAFCHKVSPMRSVEKQWCKVRYGPKPQLGDKFPLV